MQGRGIPHTFLPEREEFALLVRIELTDVDATDEFEAKGAILRPIFEAETGLKLLAGGRVIAGGEGASEQFVNLWNLTGPGALLPAMARVHDIKEYGPVDDMVRLETQDQMSAFVKQVNDRWPDKLDGAVQYYVQAEYSISSGEAGTLAFKLRGFLENFEKETGWDCFATYFPMTGPLDRYVQFFRFWSKENPAKAYTSAAALMRQVPWKPPVSLRLMRPALYDRAAVPTSAGRSSQAVAGPKPTSAPTRNAPGMTTGAGGSTARDRGVVLT